MAESSAFEKAAAAERLSAQFDKHMARALEADMCWDEAHGHALAALVREERRSVLDAAKAAMPRSREEIYGDHEAQAFARIWNDCRSKALAALDELEAPRP